MMSKRRNALAQSWFFSVLHHHWQPITTVTPYIGSSYRNSMIRFATSATKRSLKNAPHEQHRLLVVVQVAFVRRDLLLIDEPLPVGHELVVHLVLRHAGQVIADGECPACFVAGFLHV